MWWDILPSAVIVYALIAGPHAAHWAWNRVRYGRNYVRFWQKNRFDYHMYLRDERITGSIYKHQGLECIPEVE